MTISAAALERFGQLRERLVKRPRLSLLKHSPRLRESAVLLPLLVPSEASEAPPELLFIVRNAGLPTHSGQIAFPGGKREPSDASAEQTALRESHEEVGLAAERVQICGLLDDVPTIDRFTITPVVGLVEGPVLVTPSATEVADTFWAPIDVLANTYRHGGFHEWNGVSYAMHEFHFPDPSGTVRLVWGATARITYQFLELLGLLPPSPDK